MLARVALPRQLVLVLCQLRLRLRVLLHRLPLLLPPDALLFDALLLGVRLELGLFGLELLGLCYLLLPGELDDLLRVGRLVDLPQGLGSAFEGFGVEGRGCSGGGSRGLLAERERGGARDADGRKH